MPVADQLALMQGPRRTDRRSTPVRPGRQRGPDVEMVTSVRLTVAERQTLNDLADSAGITYSEVLRMGLRLLATADTDTRGSPADA